MTAAPAIEVTNLAITLGESEVLRDVSVSVAPGELLTIIGPNGAGKSTLLRAIDNLVPVAHGAVAVHGTPLARLSRRELARQISFVPQADVRALQFSVRSFVEMGRYPHLGPWATPGPEDSAAVASAFAVTETGHLAARDLQSLSGGELQRVLIAAALAQGGSILLLDEPTSFLDYRHQVQVLDLLDRLHDERGQTIIAVTHDLNPTVAMSDAVLALKEGRTAFHGPPQEILTADTLAAIYDTDFRLINGGQTSLPLIAPVRNGT